MVSQQYLRPTQSCYNYHQYVALGTTPDVDDLRSGQLRHSTDDTRHHARGCREGMLCKRAGHVDSKISTDLLLERVDVKDEEDPVNVSCYHRSDLRVSFVNKPRICQNQGLSTPSGCYCFDFLNSGLQILSSQALVAHGGFVITL